VRPHIALNLKGVQVIALIDTGSTHTLVNSTIYHQLPRLTPLRTDKLPALTSITNHKLIVRGICTLNIAGCPVDVTVCDDLGVDVLLGADFCRNAIIDFQSGTLVIGNCAYPFCCASNDNCPVMTTKPVPTSPHDCINEVLTSYPDVFSHKGTPVGASDNLPPCVIDTGDHPPIRQRAYRMPFSKREECERLVQEMLKDGIIRESDSPWASGVTLVAKRDGTTRFCIDYRRLNAITRKNSYPVPLVQDVFDAMAGAKIFSTMDLRSGYHQLKMHPDSIPKTAFMVPSGLYEFVRMPFGLTAAPAIFQRTMDRVLAGMGTFAKVFIDDIVVWSATPEEHAEHLRAVLERLRSAGLQLKTPKCHFGLDEVELLGHSVSAEGVRPLESRVEAIKNLGPPKNIHALKSFMGMANYYRNHIPGFASLAIPLTDLTKHNQPFIWGPDQQEAFEALKGELVKAPILAHPDLNKPFRLYTDASRKAVGGVLVQLDDNGVERVISYVSNKLAGPQLRWSTIEKEAFAILNALKRLHAYLWGAKFEIRTDHSALRSLFKSEIKSSKLARWSIQIQEYGAPIRYHPGKLNKRADFLSRIEAIRPEPVNSQKPLQIFTSSDLPDVWLTDQIDPSELAALQQQQFPEEYAEAARDEDDSCFVLEGGLLYSKAPPSRAADSYLRLILPREHRERVIERCHSEVGHSAFAKTICRVQEHYVWPGMRKHIRQYVRHCVLCNTLTPPHPAMPRGRVPTPPRPFHSWAIDLVGPMPRDRRGRTYMLTAIDLLTGWAEAIPVASKHAETIQEAFLTNIVARYGIPALCLSDNGGEFTGAAFEEWLREFGVEHRLTSPNHPQCNGMCERFNGTIQKLLLKLSGGNSRKWSQYLPEALYAYRITCGPAGISPYQAVFGQKPRLPRSQADGQDEGDRLRAIRLAEKVLLEFRNDQKEDYQAKEPKWAKRLPPGTYVSIRLFNSRKGECPWKPGYQVLSSHDGALRLLELATNRIIRVNQQNVREIPESKPYDEIDPKSKPEKNTAMNQADLGSAAAPRPIPIQANEFLPTHLPTTHGEHAAGNNAPIENGKVE
jgi:transposase InsO family protein